MINDGGCVRVQKCIKCLKYVYYYFLDYVNPFDDRVNDPIKSKMKFVFATDNPFGKEEKVMAGSLQMDDATMRDLRDEFHSGYIENNGGLCRRCRRVVRFVIRVCCFMFCCCPLLLCVCLGVSATTGITQGVNKIYCCVVLILCLCAR